MMSLKHLPIMIVVSLLLVIGCMADRNGSMPPAQQLIDPASLGQGVRLAQDPQLVLRGEATSLRLLTSASGVKGLLSGLSERGIMPAIRRNLLTPSTVISSGSVSQLCWQRGNSRVHP